MSPGTAANQRLREGTKPRVSCREPCGLMKPAVQKHRRDHINRSIVQLKGLLEREFHSEPNCRLEKAEILERCVSLLGHHYLVAFSSQARQPLQGYNDGYTRCLQEALCFLSARQTRGARTTAMPPRKEGGV
ncbi:transcription factor HES-5-like [Hypanus sabinus]|uniref:transcription factor HES-5-like n=1 Tax=Hypanus sabinus TaxID=79690 RepID=UPI0028C3C452|nr:transcription factor HES-5-like [Hypanus sabinus]